MSNTKLYRTEVRTDHEYDDLPQVAEFVIDENDAKKILSYSNLVKTNDLYKVERFDYRVRYFNSDNEATSDGTEAEGDDGHISTDSDCLNVTATDFWFSASIKHTEVEILTERQRIDDLISHFGLAACDVSNEYPVKRNGACVVVPPAVSALADESGTGEVFPGATLEEIGSVMMQDIIGDYTVPDDVPEWRWVEEQACFAHCHNGQHGIWEFVLNLSLSYEDVPDKLKPVLAEANQKGLGYLIIHQGT